MPTYTITTNPIERRNRTLATLASMFALSDTRPAFSGATIRRKQVKAEPSLAVTRKHLNQIATMANLSLSDNQRHNQTAPRYAKKCVKLRKLRNAARKTMRANAIRQAA